MMTTFCLVTLLLSATLLLGAVVGSVYLHKKQRQKTDANEGKDFPLSPFRLFLIGFFLAGCVMLFPAYYTEYFKTEVVFAREVKCVLLSALDTMRIFILDSDFDTIGAVVSNTQTVDKALGVAYSVYASVLYVLAPVLTAGFVLSFFKDAFAKLKYRLKYRADIYIMSELNERSIALAEDILLEKPNEPAKKRRRRAVVFADVFEKDEEGNFELVSRAKRLGAICMKRDITSIPLQRGGLDCTRKLYFIRENEDENIKQSLEMIETCRKNPKYNNYNTQFFVFTFSTDTGGEILFNSADFGAMKVRRVNENTNLVLSTLQTHSVFTDAVGREGNKQINVVIVGLGGYGTELLKTLCWCGQTVGYTVRIHAFDKDPDAPERIRAIAPDLIKYESDENAEEPFYSITFHTQTDVASAQFTDELAKIKDVTTAFVTLGDDGLNMATALKMRTQFERSRLEKGYNIPPILAVVYSDVKSRSFSFGKDLKSIQDGRDYGIRFIGDMHSRYTLQTIEQERLEKLGQACHLHWTIASGERKINEAKTDEERLACIEALKAEKQAQAEKYERYEYYRKASMAQAMHEVLREELGILPDKNGYDGALLTEYEHRRWTVFMRAEGYVYEDLSGYPVLEETGKKRAMDDIARAHERLRHLEVLSDEEWDKDARSIGAKIRKEK